MGIKSLFSKSGERPKLQLSIDDLIVLERYEEAATFLQERTRANPLDLHSHLKLAEVYVQLRHAIKALDEFLFVADSYTDDGFYDKSLALLTKAARLAPADETIQARMARNNRLKGLEHTREIAFEGLREADPEGTPLSRLSPVELHQIWNAFATTKLVDRFRADQLKRLFAACELVALPEKHTVAERGGRNEEILILIKGAVEAVMFLPESGGMQVRAFGPGDILGDAALFEKRPWPATLATTEPTRAFRLTRAGLEKALLGNPDPRGLLDGLRSQRNDRELETIARKLRALPGE